MVSFFGLKFGADKRKKRVDAPPQLTPQGNQTEEYIGRRESYFPLLATNGGINRPRTSQGTHGPRGLYPGDPLLSQQQQQQQHSESDFKGIRAVLLGTTAAVPAGTGPVLSPTLKTFSSDSNLRLSMETRNMSSTSLQTPLKRLGGEAGPRPGTAHSMRGSAAQKPSTVPLQLAKISTSASGPAPRRSFLERSPLERSPLEQNSLPSPGYCGSESSLSPGTARDGHGNEKPNLHIDLPNASTTTFGGTPKSPLGQYELPSPLKSPLKSDTDSLLGDDPGKIVDEIAARITREEEQPPAPAPPPLAIEDRRRLEAELEEQKKKLEAAKKKLELARLRMAYPSPPASIESEQDMPGRKPSIGLQAASHQEERPSSVAADRTLTPSSPASVKFDEASLTGAKRTSSSVPTIEAPLESPSIPPSTSRRSGEESTEQRSADGEQHVLNSQMLRPQQQSYENIPQGPTSSETGTNAPPPPLRSPLFQQMTPFDIHSDEDYDEEEHMVDYRVTNAPYGLPSPPLSHHQRPSKEDNNNNKNNKEDVDIEGAEAEGLPVLRTVQAKRDTTLVGAAGRASLGLQIEEFEKSLQQAQAMSALENRPEVIIRSRANSSNASSAYSEDDPSDDDDYDDDDADEGESPMILEPPLISPKPFPLTPRPVGPPRSSTSTANSTMSTMTTTGRPLLEVRSESPFGSFLESFAHETAGMMEGREEKKTTPTTPLAVEQRPRPRLGAVKPSRPTLGEYGPVKVHTTSSAAAATTTARGVQRPSLDEYDVNPYFPRSVVVNNNSSGFDDIESPILKDVVRQQQIRSPGGPNRGGDATIKTTDCGGLSSTATSCTTSPIAGVGVGSYSVFSPPPPPTIKKQRPILGSRSNSSSTGQFARSPRPEWYGPAPSAPPTSPLPIPEKSSNSSRLPTTPTQPSQQQQQQTLAMPGLRTSPSIVPDLTNNPNWPLPAPSLSAPSSGFASPPHEVAGAGGFTARRSLHHRDSGRAPPPAPINIMATRYADEVGGGDVGPWTPQAATTNNTTTPTSTLAGGGACGGFELRSDFSGWKEERAPYQRGDMVSTGGGEENPGGIGLARGLSIKYDKIRERERRVRGHDQKKRMAIVTVDEEDAVVPAPGPLSPTTKTTTTTTGEPFDRLRRPNHGLKSPTGFADEQGIRFI
ncbi:hypothetical protein N0V82_009458 [Gnomoniopsis sp. IMI 355080]|nr:hypothetical protein N0V82_009458 [Gnomoniopsis sp. IMI 355080]